MSCLSDENPAALVDGPVDAVQTDEWNRHIDSCDRYAARLLRKQRAGNQRESSDPDPDATITPTQRTKEKCDDLMPNRHSSHL